MPHDYLGGCPETHLEILTRGKFRNLKRLELAYLTKIESISAIEELMNTSIEVLDFLKCRKISDHDAVKCLASLKTLKFNDCGEIPNIRFLNEMCNLEEFRFVNTNVLDGDLSPLLKLKAVGFFAKKHYSHSPEDIDARIGCY
jgi:protein phosphatase 1 regulatory subunit 7